MSGHPLVGMVLLYPIFHNSARGSVILLTQFFKKSTEILKSQPFPAQNRFLRGRLTPEFAQKVRECSCRFSARHARRWRLRRPAGRTFWLVLTAEALTAPPPPRALELNAELDALCAAVRELADCRAGWLYFCPAYAPLPAAVPRALLQGTVLTFLRGVLRSERRAAVRLAAQRGAAVLALQGGDSARMPGDLPALLHRCGAYVTATGSGFWAAAVRLPLSPALPLREPPAPADLVLDRYSAAKVYLDGLCVEDVE